MSIFIFTSLETGQHFTEVKSSIQVLWTFAPLDNNAPALPIKMYCLSSNNSLRLNHEDRQRPEKG